LTVAELKKLSLVSRDFNRNVGTSMNFQTRVRFSLIDLEFFDNKKSRHNLRAVMEKSVRKYTNLSIRSDHAATEEIETLFKNDWTEASLNISEFSSTVEFVKYLGLIIPTLTSLSLTIQDIQQFIPYFKTDFPCLVELNFFQCTSVALECFLKDEINTCLEKLTLSSVTQSPSRHASNLTNLFCELVENFSNLTFLDIQSTANAESFFKHKISNVAFKLTRFRIESPVSEKSCENIENFIITQGTSLKELCMSTWRDFGVIRRIWESLEVIAFLQVNNLRDELEFSESDTTPLSKKTLSSLYLLFPKSQLSTDFLQPLIDAVKDNLQVLKIKANFDDLEIYEVVREAADYVLINDIVVKSLIDVHSSSSECSGSSSESEDSDSNLETKDEVVLLSDTEPTQVTEASNTNVEVTPKAEVVLLSDTEPTQVTEASNTNVAVTPKADASPGCDASSEFATKKETLM
jgi:hypothetical protein